MFKHEIKKLKEKYENIKWWAHYYDAELLVVAAVFSIVLLLYLPFLLK